MDREITSVELPHELKEKLKNMAKDRELSLSGLIRLILKDWVNINDKN